MKSTLEEKLSLSASDASNDHAFIRVKQESDLAKEAYRLTVTKEGATKNKEALASKEAMKYWLPVDWYNGGMEHTTLHLLYSRFWHKFLYDQGVVTCPEPYQKRTSHGMILGENGEKMSKSRGNVVNPDDIVAEFGADTLRL